MPAPLWTVLPLLKLETRMSRCGMKEKFDYQVFIAHYRQMHIQP